MLAVMRDVVVNAHLVMNCDELDLTSSSEKSDKITGFADPEWSSDTWKASLDDNGLAVRSISV